MVKIVDWAGNDIYPGRFFDTDSAAWDYLTWDQHNRHPNATEQEFEDIMGELKHKGFNHDKAKPVARIGATDCRVYSWLEVLCSST